MTAVLDYPEFMDKGGQVVSHPSDPYDLSLGVKTILNRISKMRNSLRGSPFVVLMAEAHPIASHRLLQLLTLSAAHEKYRDDVGFSDEESYNVALSHLVDEGYSLAEASELLSADHDGQLSLNEMRLKGSGTVAPKTNSALLDLCAKQRISTCFSDAAKFHLERNLVDTYDQNMKAVLKGSKFEGTGPVDALTASGMEMRNMFMAHRTLAHMQREKMQFMILGTGYNHIFGAFNKFSLEGSLARQFEKAGIPFLAVLPFGNYIFPKNFPLEASRFFGQTIAVTGMDETPFYDDDSNAEECYVVKMLSASGVLEVHSESSAGLTLK